MGRANKKNGEGSALLQGDKLLTFRGPCIVMCSYNESQRDALFLKFI